MKQLKTTWTSGGVTQPAIITRRGATQSAASFIAAHAAAVTAAVGAAPIDPGTSIVTEYTTGGSKATLSHSEAVYGSATLSTHLAAVEALVLALE